MLLVRILSVFVVLNNSTELWLAQALEDVHRNLHKGENVVLVRIRQVRVDDYSLPPVAFPRPLDSPENCLGQASGIGEERYWIHFQAMGGTTGVRRYVYVNINRAGFAILVGGNF